MITVQNQDNNSPFKTTNFSKPTSTVTHTFNSLIEPNQLHL